MAQGLPPKEHGMARGEGLFSWMMWDAMDQRLICGVARVVAGHLTIVTTEKTPALSVIKQLDRMKENDYWIYCLK